MSKKNQLVDFRAVRAAVSMEQVLSHYGLLEQMKRSGDSLSGCCPIHKGTNPTQFRVSVSKNVWNCFTQCKRGGNVIDFIAGMEKLTAYGAAQKAIEWFTLDSDRVYPDPESAGNEPAGKPSSHDPKPRPPASPQAVPKIAPGAEGKSEIGRAHV